MSVRKAIVLLGGAAVLAGCQRGRAGEFEGPFADKVAAAVPQIERAVGLPFRQPPRLEVRDRDQVREFLEARFNEDLPTRELIGFERAYKRFGLLPDTMQLRAFLLDLLTEQVVGYYDPKQKVLYIVDGAPDDLVGVTIIHELVHALQDQYVDLDSIQNLTGDNDRQTAIQAVIEGQATFEQLAIMLGDQNFADRIPGGWDRARDVIRQSSASMPLFYAAPMLIQETLIFPYVNGAEFMRRFKRENPGQVPYGDMPVSTSQIMHADKYGPGVRRDPWRVVLPAATGGTSIYENNLGEFETRLFLWHHIRGDVGTAARGARGWNGDRYVIVETPQGDALAWVTVWDTPVAAALFHDLMQRMIGRRYRTTTPATESDTSRTYRTAARTLTLTTFEIDGQPAVGFLDVPAGVTGQILDMGAVRLEPLR